MTVTTVNVKPKSSADSDSDADSDAEDAQALGKDGEYNFSRVSKHRIKEFYLGNRMYKTHGLCCYGAAYSLDGTLIAACGQVKEGTASKVDLPAPFLPIMPMRLPSATRR